MTNLMLVWVILLPLSWTVIFCDFYRGMDPTVVTFDGRYKSTSKHRVDAYLSKHGNSKGEIKTIGRSTDTGPGTIGSCKPPLHGDESSCGVPDGSKTNAESHGDFNRVEWRVYSDAGSERTGVFYFTAQNDGYEVNITTIKIPFAAKTYPADSQYTHTVGIGDSVSLRVSGRTSSLRWRHNGGVEMFEKNGHIWLDMEDIRKADSGIYECYEYGERENGEHAIFRLIVRDCQTGWWGSECENKCPSCYNGGVCEAQTGVCICQPGFAGGNCQTACGKNTWGEGCGIVCQNDGNCKNRLFCGADPVGCSCSAGFWGLDCNHDCSADKYTKNSWGSDCRMDCGCDGKCHRATGECKNDGICKAGYKKYNGICQENSCAGKWGGWCRFNCHCKNSETCNTDTGACNGECEEGWGGEACQRALPRFYTNQVYSFNARCVKPQLNWNDWQFERDYGVGPVHSYNLHYGFKGHDLSMNHSNVQSGVEIWNLVHETEYEFNLACVQDIEGTLTDGPPGETLSFKTECFKPSAFPFIKDFRTDTDSIEIKIQLPQGEDWQRCNSGITVIIGYRACLTSEDDIELPPISEPITDAWYSLGHLTECSCYQIRLSAQNRDCSSDKSPYTAVTTNTTGPNAIDDLHEVSVTTSLIELLWTDPGGKCPVSYYKVEIYEANDNFCNNQDSPVIEHFTNSPSITLSGLKVCSIYGMYVTAFSDDIPGPISNKLCIKTDGDAPSQIRDLLIQSQVWDSFNVSWNTPLHLCGVPSYEVCYGLINFDQCNQTIDFPKGCVFTDKTSTILNSLESYSSYNVSVTPYLGNLTGDTVEEVKSTLQTVPGFPNNVKSNDTTQGDLGFTWEKPLCGERHGVIIKYGYEFSDSQSEQYTTTTAVVFTNLEHFTQYSFRIRAYTAEGPGKFTEWLTVRTAEAATPVAFLNTYVLRKATGVAETYTTPDSAPTNLNWTAAEENIIHFSWSLPPIDTRNGIILGYEYEFNGSHGTVLSTSMEFQDLAHCTCFEFRIKAFTSAGKGPNAETVACTLTPELGQVVKLNAISISSISINVSWAEPFPLCGVPTYNTTVQLINRDQCEEVNDGPQNNYESISTYVVISALESYCTYSIVVVPFVHENLGQPSGPVLATTLEGVLEEPPTDISCDSSVQGTLTFTWLPPPCGQRHGKIKGYEYELRGVLGETFTEHAYVIISGLDHYTEYDFHVRGLIQSGGGSFTDWFRARTAEAEPSGFPQEVYWTALDEHELSFTWSPPPISDQNGIITGYDYELGDIEGHTSATYMVFRDLPHCTCFQFRLRAVNSAGKGPFTIEIAACTLAPDLGKVTALIALAISNEGLDISWSAPSHLCGRVPMYEITIRLTNLDQCKSVMDDPPQIVETPENALKVSGLISYSTYEITALAKVDQEIGPKSNPAVCTTMGLEPSEKPIDLEADSSQPAQLGYKWDQVPCGSRHSFITGYQYTFSEENGKSLISEFTDKYYEFFSELKHYTFYRFEIGAVNTLGDVGPVAIKVVQTLESTPSKPRDIALTQKGYTELTISWRIPDEPNGIIEKYKIMVLLGDNDIQQHFFIEEKLGNYMTTTILELEAGTVYIIRISAYTLGEFGGEGEYSDPFETHTELETGAGTPAPLQPEDMAVTSIIAITVGVCIFICLVIVVLAFVTRRSNRRDHSAPREPVNVTVNVGNNCGNAETPSADSDELTPRTNRDNPLFEDEDSERVQKGSGGLFKIPMLSSNIKFHLDDEGDFGETSDEALLIQPMPDDIDVYESMPLGGHAGGGTFASVTYNAYESLPRGASNGLTSVYRSTPMASSDKSGENVRISTISSAVHGEANVVIYETDDD